MKRIFVAVLAINTIIGALVVSRSAPAKTQLAGGTGAPKDMVIQVDKGANPWNHLKMNNAAATFRFAIVSDRTGDARDGVWEKAMDQLNLLQPEFVMCVGDLVQGSQNLQTLDKQWKEFNGHVAKLEMPFFYVPGNHDIGSQNSEKRWNEQFGRRWYHFVYKDVLFLMLDCLDLPGKFKAPKFGPEQIADAKKILADNRDVRWTLVFTHMPVWKPQYGGIDQNGWQPIEEALQGRKYTVFTGHEHRYERQIRQGMIYYTLATTGGGSKLRGAPMGEFDHIVWMTLKSDGPHMTNLLMEGIFSEDIKGRAAH